jgi:F-type H+-transporting ATPase subunit delta
MTAANEYAKALFAVSEERGSSDAVCVDARDLIEIISQNKGYTVLLDSPALSLSEKLSLIDGAFESFDKDLKNTVKLLSEKRLCHALVLMLTEYISLYEASRGIIHVEVITAVPMTDAQEARLTEKLARETGKTIVIDKSVDASILGGIKLRYLGREKDASLKTRLLSIEKRIKSTIIN